MKILFICGSLEYGRDGVGDYTRRLAGELIRQGHEAAIIALNDRHISAIEDTEQETENTKISVLRLPAGIKNKERYILAKKHIDSFNPKWLSLQLVIYGFQKKGLPFGLPHHLKKLGKGHKWHIMFHELWVGTYYTQNSKTTILRFLQKKILVKLIKNTRPKVINTHCSLYKYKLEKLGYKTETLPLFSNIPIIDSNSTKRKRNEFILVIFGSIHPNKPFASFAKKLKDVGTKHNYIFEIRFIGKNGREIETWINCLEKEHINYKIYGEMSTESISKQLAQADIGITSTPSIMAEKSGTIMAMIEHGLKIISVSEVDTNNKNLISIRNPMNLFTFDGGEIDLQLFNRTGKDNVANTLEYVTNLFIKYLISSNEL